MKLLIDSDAFCKLAVGGLLEDAAGLLGADLQDCGRLPALPHMLRRGRLRKMFGPERCDHLLHVANAIPVAARASDDSLDRLTGMPAIDPGEAQLFATAAEHGLLIMTGDKRALHALKRVPYFTEPLSGRIVVMEAILLALCDHLSAGEVRSRVEPLRGVDTLIRICFSAGQGEPDVALRSYFSDLVTELEPLTLWSPGQRDEP